MEEILVEDGRAAGVRLKSGEVLRASQAVVSNASLHDTTRMLPGGHAATQQLQQQAEVAALQHKQ